MSVGSADTSLIKRRTRTISTWRCGCKTKVKKRKKIWGGVDPYQVKRLVGTDNTEYGLEHESIDSQIQTRHF